MIDIIDKTVFLVGDKLTEDAQIKGKSIARKILEKHNVGKNENLEIKFDALASHDITYVGIVQTAKTSGLEQFPVPYALTNCHNSLCAVGGTINEDDHVFGLSAAKKYGGIFVPAHMAVIHQYVRETMTGCGRMVLGSDSHTRYGALGTMGIGEGGPELVKQLLGRTYNTPVPQVIAVYLEGSPIHGVGPQDVALAIIGAVFKNGFVKNKVLEFIGPGVKGLSVDFRNGIDVMTTEAACMSSIWVTDEKVKEYYRVHGREEGYAELMPDEGAEYDGAIIVNLSKLVPLIALPFHPSNVYTISEFNENFRDILEIPYNSVDGKFKVDQAIIAGCSGGMYENIALASNILEGTNYSELSLSIYPSSQPVFLSLNKNGYINKLATLGVTIRTAFCGPCFGAGDVPQNNGFSIRHTTRNFPNREGSRPMDGQTAAVALMDARSIAATVSNGGFLISATEVDYNDDIGTYEFEQEVYNKRVYSGYGNPMNEELHYGPNIKEWPKMEPLGENLLLKIACVIDDEVTTTDELIPSGETSSYRSNPMRLAEFTLSRKDPEYVERAKMVQSLKVDNTSVGSVVVANKPGDGSAREQAASCQKVLGGWANIAVEYATKRYRSNLINWGLVPFIIDRDTKETLKIDDCIFIPNVRKLLESGAEEITAYVNDTREIKLFLPGLTEDERKIILEGCLMNYYRRY